MESNMPTEWERRREKKLNEKRLTWKKKEWKMLIYPLPPQPYWNFKYKNTQQPARREDEHTHKTKRNREGERKKLSSLTRSHFRGMVSVFAMISVALRFCTKWRRRRRWWTLCVCGITRDKSARELWKTKRYFFYSETESATAAAEESKIATKHAIGWRAV